MDAFSYGLSDAEKGLNIHDYVYTCVMIMQRAVCKPHACHEGTKSCRHWVFLVVDMAYCYGQKT